MMVIERVTDREFLKDYKIIDLKPQNLIAPTISIDVPSTSAAAHATLSSLAAPPPPALLPRSVASLGCSRVCLLGAVTPVSAKTFS
jgi:hypothetical protein